MESASPQSTPQKMETFTLKQIVTELLPKHYGIKADEKFEIIFPDQIVDACIGAIQLDKKLLATFRFRFTNSLSFFNEHVDAYLKVVITDLVYCVKEPVGEPAAVEDVTDDETKDNVPAAKPVKNTTLPIKSKGGRGRGKQ